MSESVQAKAETKPYHQQQSTRKHVRHPPSVPFIWEQRPGLPKPDWKNPSSTTSPPPPALPPPVPPPVKLVASVPFAWEETPGKPFPCFADDPSLDSVDPPPEFLSLPPPPMYANHGIGDEFDGTNSDIDDVSSNSFSSAPSLLAANCLSFSEMDSGSVPVDGFDDLNRETESSPASPAYDSDDSTCSYMTGASSLVGAPLLEKLFPFLPPDSGFIRNIPAGSEEVSVFRASDKNVGFPVRKAPTLGELIMMSRRRSYMRRAIEMRKQNPPMEFSNEATKCCPFVPGIKMMEGLEWKKFQPRLKLM